MENCLVSKLKVSVDNPNLPIFETMLQHTEDAITLSGNTSMTDDQKWALNHLFFVLESKGIMNKLTGIFLPIICSSKSAAQYDFKSLKPMISYADTILFDTIDPKSVYNNAELFAANTLSRISVLDNANMSVYTLFTSPFSLASNTGNYGLSVMNGSIYYGVRFKRTADYDYAQFGASSQQYLNVRAYRNQDANVYAFYTSIANHNANSAVIDIKGEDGKTVKNSTTFHPTEDAYVDTTVFSSGNSKYLTLNESHVGIYIFSVSYGLTKNEMEIINEAAFALKNAFI